MNYKNNLCGTLSKQALLFCFVLLHMLIILQWGGFFTIFTPRMTLFFMISVAFVCVIVTRTLQVMAFF